MVSWCNRWFVAHPLFRFSILQQFDPWPGWGGRQRTRTTHIMPLSRGKMRKSCWAIVSSSHFDRTMSDSRVHGGVETTRHRQPAVALFTIPDSPTLNEMTKRRIFPAEWWLDEQERDRVAAEAMTMEDAPWKCLISISRISLPPSGGIY